MRKFIIWLIALIEWIIVLTPLLMVAVLDRESQAWGFIWLELILFLLIPRVHSKIYKEEESIYDNNHAKLVLLLLQFVLVNLFIAVSIYSKQDLLENKNYYLPIFIIDFFESKQVALKLVSITLICVLNQILYHKTKEIFD